MFVMIDKTRKKEATIFYFTGKVAFFSKVCVFNNLLGPDKCYCKFHSNCQTSLWTLTIVSWGLSQSMIRWKSAKNFCHREKSLFLKCFFYRPLRSQRSDIIIWTIIVKILCGPLQVVHWRLSFSIKGENLGQNLFFTRMIAFFPKDCVFKNLLGLKNLILSLPQKLSRCLLDPYHLIPDLSHVWYNEKNRPKYFLHWKVCRFFKNLLGPEVLIL